MKYQITCNHCGTRFLVDGKGGQTIECTCPGCEGKMRVTLPKTKKDADSDSSDANDSYQQGYVRAATVMATTATRTATTVTTASVIAAWP